MIGKITLAELKANQIGTVIEICGGQGLIRRLEAMGIRAGNKLVKVSRGFMWGPITVKVNNILISIGHGMAGKIIVKAES